MINSSKVRRGALCRNRTPGLGHGRVDLDPREQTVAGTGVALDRTPEVSCQPLAVVSMRETHRPHYAWIVVAVTFVATIMVAGVRATPTVLIVPLEQEFHWSRATISFAIGINLLLYGAVGPFAAAVMDRFGARRTLTLALA